MAEPSARAQTGKLASIPPDLGSALSAPGQQRAAASRTPLGSFRAFQSYLQHSSSLCDLGKSLYLLEPQVPWVESEYFPPVTLVTLQRVFASMAIGTLPCTAPSKH